MATRSRRRTGERLALARRRPVPSAPVARAADEDAALEQVRRQAESTISLYGGWTTEAIDAEVIEMESTYSLNGAPVPGGAALMSVEELAAHVGVRRGALYEWIQRGEIEAVRIGARVFIRREVLSDFITAHSRVGNRPVST